MYDENSDEITKPATDVFEINDFTAASDWENFIDDIENMLRNWKLGGANKKEKPLEKGDFSTYNWKSRSETIQFHDFVFRVSHYKLNLDDDGKSPEISPQSSPKKQETENEGDHGDGIAEGDQPNDGIACSDLLSSSNDFTDKGPMAARLFGLREVIMMAPAGTEVLGSDTRAKMVVGAINIALNNTSCQVPVLVQVMKSSHHIYCGTLIANNAKTDFSSIQLNKRPAHCAYLSGLLDLFKNKINSPLPVEVPPCRVNVRFSYELEDWASHSWSQNPPDLELFSMSGDTDFLQLEKLPFGCVRDPVSGLTLHATWRDMGEELITDTAVHTDLEPLEAPEWSVSICLADNPDCLLTQHLSNFLALCGDPRTCRQLLGDVMNEGEDVGMEKALDKLAGSSYSLSDLTAKVRPLRSARTGGPLSNELLQFILSYLFPDSDKNTSPYPDMSSPIDLLPDYAQVLRLELSSAKSAPVDGLVYRLAVTLAYCLQCRGAGGVAHLLHEFCMEVRYRWETGVFLPGLPRGPPDQAYSLIHQKLQLINCCIARKKAREERGKREETPEPVEQDHSDSDEFYECEEDEDDNVEDLFTLSAPVAKRANVSLKKSLPAWAQPEGRAERLGNLKLLEVDEWMYKPLMQDPAPLTEDQLAEQTEVLVQLGSAGSEVRARMQSASLLSDMESFKAANPGAVLADFVRWHSPRDWEEESGLSARMKSAGNMWAELWEQARAVPARRQRRLFDDTREAEKVLQFLVDLNPGDVAQLLLPTLLQAGQLRLLEERQGRGEDAKLETLNEDIAKKLGAMSRFSCLPEVRHYKGNVMSYEFTQRTQYSEDICKLLQLSELRISQGLSLRKKFVYDLQALKGDEEMPDAIEEMERFVASLGVGGEVKVIGAARGPAGRLIQSMFQEAQQDDYPRPGGMPPPSCKQFVMRTLAPRPFPYSRPMPQRIYIKLANGEFKVAGALTIDRQYT